MQDQNVQAVAAICAFVGLVILLIFLVVSIWRDRRTELERLEQNCFAIIHEHSRMTGWGKFLLSCLLLVEFGGWIFAAAATTVFQQTVVAIQQVFGLLAVGFVIAICRRRSYSVHKIDRFDL